MTTILFIAGLICLIIGAEALVKGASRMASAIGISPLVVGLTVVAWGTSSPELAVSVKSALSGQASIALGNVVGSNIFNVLFILGLSAIVVPLLVSRQLVRIDVPLMIGISTVVLGFAWDQTVSRFDGIVLLIVLLIYTAFLIYQSQRESRVKNATREEVKQVALTHLDWGKNIIFVIGGLALLVLGARWLVNSAVAFAKYMGVSELIVGLTIIAAGTSMPEVVTSLVAAFRGNQDIAVGNVVGSNIFNIMGVLGIAGVVASAGIEVSEAIYHFDIPIMIAVAFACLPIFFTGGTISRWEGGLLLGYYAAYTLYLIFASTQHEALPIFSTVMFYFVIPLSAITLLVIAIQELRNK
jgi:cation:H+ antiporter